MADWSTTYKSKWEMVKRNPDTWMESSNVVDLDDFSLSKNIEDQTPLIETGTVHVDSDSMEDELFETGWYTIYLIARFVDGDVVKEPIATLLFEESSDQYYFKSYLDKLDGYSVLKPVAESKFMACEYLPKGSDGAEWCAEQIRSCSPAPVEVHGRFVVSEHYVFEGGENRLAGVWKILDSAGWIIQIEGDGTIHLLEKPTEITLDLADASAQDIITLPIDRERNIADTVNRYIAVKGSKQAVVVNDDPDSETSYQSRGRHVDEYDDDVVLLEGDTMESYAARQLEKLSVIKRTYTYDREYVPGVYPGSKGRARIPGMDEEEFYVIQQTYSTQHGLKISETVVAEESTWQRN